jgi:hypothetical protein
LFKKGTFKVCRYVLICESQEIEEDLPPFSESYKKAKREFTEMADDEHDIGDNYKNHHLLPLRFL